MNDAPPNTTPERRPQRQFLQPGDVRPAQAAFWLFAYGAVSNAVLHPQGTDVFMFVLCKLNLFVVALALLVIGLRFIWRYIPGWARLLSTLTLLSALIGLAYYSLISGLAPRLSAGIGWMLIVVAILLFPLAALFAVTAMEGRR
jgi:hypothetical protein